MHHGNMHLYMQTSNVQLLLEVQIKNIWLKQQMLIQQMLNWFYKWHSN